MADRESQLREAARKQLEMLRSRPRGKHDTPSLAAWFDPAHETLKDGVYKFVDLLNKLKGQNRYIEEWREVRTPEEHDKATGLDPITYPEEYIEFLKENKGETDDYFSLGPLAFSQIIFPNDPRHYSAILGYYGGILNSNGDHLNFDCYPDEDHNLTLDEWLGMIRIIVEWRRPRIVTVGSGAYGIYDRVFDHRAWDGWIGWFPQRVDPRILPDYALTFEIGTGTAVATQETNVLSRFADQKERANEVEIALVEAGILPTSAEVKGAQ